jgi:hypothetical protein
VTTNAAITSGTVRTTAPSAISASYSPVAASCFVFYLLFDCIETLVDAQGAAEIAHI